MKEINFSYKQSKDFVKRGINLSGMYSITKGKKILFTVLCAYIIINSGYIMISTAKITIIHLIYILFGAAILAYTWLLPQFIINRKIKSTDETLEVEISLKPAELIETKGEKKTEITARDYRGYQTGEEMYVVYGATNYVALPTDTLSDEEKEDLEEILKYFHNPDYFKSEEEKAKDNEPEFEPFVPPEGFQPEEETITVENEDTANE